MAHDVFISYSSEDKATAEAMCTVLERKGCKCWIAPRDIAIGKPYAGAIIDAIKKSRVMVFIFSSRSNSSPHVMRELECAAKKGAPIIPFRIEDVHPSESIEYFVSAINWLDAFPQPEEKHFEILADHVEKLLSGTEVIEKGKEVKPPGGEGAQIPVAEGLPGEDELNEYEKDLRVVEDLLKRKQWMSCVRKCGILFEKGLRQLLSNLLDSSKDKAVLDRIMEAQEKIGKGKARFESFSLAELISLYEEAQIFDELRKHLTSILQKIKMINWEQAVQWYNVSKHEHNSTSLDVDDATQMFFWTKVFAYDCELAGKAVTVAPVPEGVPLQECPCCKQPLETDWSFCPQCGVALKVVCDACNRTLAPDFRICPYCETPIRQRGVVDMDRVQKAKEEYRVLCTGAYLDGVMNARERALLDTKRLELGLSMEEAESIERRCAPENVVEYTRLVEGVLVDGKIDDAEAVFLQKKAKQMNIDPWVAKQIDKEVVAGKKGT